MAAIPGDEHDEMPAAPLPSEPAPDEAAEGWALLDGLRRRLDDQAVQGRKTAAQVQQLADSIAALVEHQRQRARWLNMNSFVAYVVFTLLLGGGFYFLYQSRAHDLIGARDRALADRDAAGWLATEVTARAMARTAADVKAQAVWQLLETGHRDEAGKRLAMLDAAPISRFDRDVLVARAKQADATRVDAAIKAGLAALKVGRETDAIAALEPALAVGGSRTPELQYLIGVAHARAGEPEKAIGPLAAAVAADVSDDDARFQLASALDRVGQWGKARAEYDRFATAHPQSPFAVFAMRRSATLARMPAVQPIGQPAPAVVTPRPVPVASPKPAQPLEKSEDGSAAPLE